jgi:hypothetical protein
MMLGENDAPNEAGGVWSKMKSREPARIVQVVADAQAEPAVPSAVWLPAWSRVKTSAL